MPGYVTPNLGLGFLSETQAGKATSVNEFLLRLDAVAQASVIDWTLTAPPVSPVEGDRYVVPVGATGAWAGHDKTLAAFYGVWRFFPPRKGFTAYCEAIGDLIQYDGTTWSEGTGINALSELVDVDVYGATVGQVLTLDGTGSWVPATPSMSAAALDDLTDVNAPSPAGGQVLAWDAASASWKSTTPTGGGATTLDELADVSAPTPTAGQVLTFDGTNWTPATPAAGGGGSSEILAWCNYCGTPGSQGIRASKNIASVTVTGFGSYRFDFITPMPDLNYAIVFGGRFDSAATDSTVTIASEARIIAAQGNSRTLTYFRSIVGYQAAGGFDVDTLSIVVVR